MARESRRSRFDKRFGKPSRLHDRLMVDDWSVPDWYPTNSQDLLIRTMHHFRGQLERAKSIEASNVFDYWVDQDAIKQRQDQGWDASQSFPGFTLPFDEMFIEGAPAQGMNGVKRWGALLTRETPGGSGVDMCKGATSLSLAMLFINSERFDRPSAPYLVTAIMANDHGMVLDIRSSLYCPSEQDRSARPHFPQGFDYEAVVRMASAFLVPCLLAVSFMNCKNVSKTAIEPDRNRNELRQRHGLKPFLRYHTINIEPMKSVLRDEGDIEQNGLKKALHICRGYFATYGEDKPLFGRTTGTFWVPAHVRGSFKNGIVKSDYRVRSPEVAS